MPARRITVPEKSRRLREDATGRVRYTVKDLPATERPRERLLELGPEALSPAELLAIVLRTGTTDKRVTELAQDLLKRFGGLDGLRRALPSEICQVYGLGPAKAAQILAALELGRRLQAEAPPERVYSIRSPENVAEMLGFEMERLEQEHLYVVLLDNKHRVVGKPLAVYKGNASGAVVRSAELFRDAVRQNMPAIVLAHNHPSGDPNPSAEDVEVTRQALEAGANLDIAVLDHIIIGRRQFVSLRRERPGLAWPA
jgi:DNA repair protein RadC